MSKVKDEYGLNTCGHLIIFPTTYEFIECPKCKAQYEKISNTQYELIKRGAIQNAKEYNFI